MSLEKSERDMLIAIDTKLGSVCRSMDELRDRMETQYATKDYVDARIPKSVESSSNTFVMFLNSKAGMVLIICIVCLVVLGALSLFPTVDTAASIDQIEQIIQDQIKAQLGTK